ncbi:pentapeptide repeat-containing protein (plasmid) [Streptomyces californicus]|nr:pentapeptide repeat-containing protein [Streptomyces californicus]QRV59621.1 pentapeptide repeat-containing protein [Streptomyces californicus]
MPHPSFAPSSTPPDWPHCGHDTTPEDPVGCRGIHVLGHTACLAHLADAGRDAYLASLSAGTDIDHRGTPFTEHLLNRLLDALSDPTDGHPRFGRARFDEASFADARFSNVAFIRDVSFCDVTFTGIAWFIGAVFENSCFFNRAKFFRGAVFRQAVFTGTAEFWCGHFETMSSFNKATFASDVHLGGTVFRGAADFDETRFKMASRVGPFACFDIASFRAAEFDAPVQLEIAADLVILNGARWASKAAIQLRYAYLDLSDAVLEYPVTVTTHPTPFPSYPMLFPLPEGELTGRDLDVRIVSLTGVDTAYLALHNVDLTECRFAGAVHLDQLRVDGWCTFATAPADWGWRFPWRWSRRRVLVEEHDWRARSGGRSYGWRIPHETVPTLRPAALAALYRELRKSLEDGKNEPGAADFYFGESEMRRHDKDDTTCAERLLLTAYWAFSGYGLRASRALGWLTAAMTITVVLLMGFGIPQNSPRQEATGTVPTGGGRVTFEIDKADPQNPTGDRFTGERFDKAFSVTLNSVVFRSTSQDLTTAGTYIEMVSRVAEPVLLGLAILAVRNRVKR